MDLTSFAFESGAWHNQFDPEVFTALNKNIDGLYLDLEKGEIIHVVFPIIMYDFQFSDDDWSVIDDHIFQIVIGCYPEKNVLITGERGL